MSWHFLRGAAGESTEACCLDTLPFAPWKLSQAIAGCCCSAKPTECSHDSQFGTTCVHSMEDRGLVSLTSCQADSLAKTSALPEAAQGLTENAPAYGARWHALLARYDPATHTLRTPQCSLLGDLTECSVILPRWGSMRNGELSERTTPGHLTSVTASGFLPTISATDVKGRSGAGHIERHGAKRLSDAILFPTPVSTLGASKTTWKATDSRTKPNKLGWAVAEMWPTPTVNGNNNRAGLTAKSGDGLATAVKRFATPAASDATRGGACITENMTGQSLRQQIGGRLNPEFVEWLMGWPIGSTAFSPLATDRFREWWLWHGEPSNDKG